MTGREALVKGLRELKPGQCWRTSSRDLVVIQVDRLKRSVEFWATGYNGRLRKTTIGIDRFFLDYSPKLRT